MKKTTTIWILVLVLLVPITYGAGGDYMDYLSRGYGDTLYCMINGDCKLNSLNVTNLTYLQVSSINVTDIIGEHWVNESGDTGLTGTYSGIGLNFSMDSGQVNSSGVIRTTDDMVANSFNGSWNGSKDYVKNNTDGAYQIIADNAGIGKIPLKEFDMIGEAKITLDSNSPTFDNVGLNISQTLNDGDIGYGIWINTVPDAGLGREEYTALFIAIDGQSAGGILEGMGMSITPSSAYPNPGYETYGYGTNVEINLDDMYTNYVWGHKVTNGVISGPGQMTGFEANITRAGDSWAFRAINGKSEFRNTTVSGVLNVTDSFYASGTIGNGTHRYTWAELNESPDLSTYLQNKTDANFTKIYAGTEIIIGDGADKLKINSTSLHFGWTG